MNNEKIKELSRFRDEIIKRENWYIRHKKQKTQEKLENATLFLYDFLCDELKKMEQVILDTDDKVKINFSYSEYLCKDINVDKFDMNFEQREALILEEALSSRKSRSFPNDWGVCFLQPLSSENVINKVYSSDYLAHDLAAHLRFHFPFGLLFQPSLLKKLCEDNGMIFQENCSMQKTIVPYEIGLCDIPPCPCYLCISYDCSIIAPVNEKNKPMQRKIEKE